MANLSDYAEDAFIDHIFRDGTFSKPSTIAFALTSGVPVDGSTSGNIGELPLANGYTRVGFGPSDAHWSAPGATGTTENIQTITFPTCTTAAWGWVSGIAIFDASGHGTGNLLMWGALEYPQYVNVNGTVSYPTGEFKVNFN
jgi:hypothetical protein